MGLRTGRFTSPHLHDVRERIALDGEPISRQAFLAAYEDVLPFVEMVDASFAERGVPRMNYFQTLVAVNQFDAAPQFELDEVREALGVVDDVPVVQCDARRRESVKDVLVALTEEVLTRRLAEDAMGARR